MNVILIYRDGSVHVLSLGLQKEGLSVSQTQLSVSLPGYSLASLIKCSHDIDTIVCVQEKFVVVYTTLLELRAMISLEGSSIVDCCLSRYGLFLMINRQRGGIIRKYNYCGDFVNDLSISSEMYDLFMYFK